MRSAARARGDFGWYRRDSLAMVACLAWGATNFQDASVYIADAPYQRLELIGGEHDWAFVLGHEGLDRMHQAAQIASTVRGIGVLILIVAIGLGVSGLLPCFQYASAKPGRGQGSDARRPVADNVAYAVFRSGPPQHTLVTIGSGSVT